MPLQITRDEMSRNKPVSLAPSQPWGGPLLGALHEAPATFGKFEMTTENRSNMISLTCVIMAIFFDCFRLV